MEDNRINILWIEDNPLLTERKESGEHDGTEKIKKDGKDFLIPSMKSLGNEAALFNLKILQHPEEIREYLTMCSKVVDTKGPSYLSNADGVVPDIVVFDYMLNENFSTTGKHCISYAAVMKPIRKMFNPTYSFLAKPFDELFEKYVLFPERSINYTDEDLFQQINYDFKNKMLPIINRDIESSKDDEFGLYAGITIFRFFKEHITCGLPATFNKKDRSSLQPTAKYFEWLNGYDLENALQRENKGNKDWKSVLTDGAILLRKRIESQLASGRIMVCYSHLNELSEKNLPDARVFTFDSDFGSKNLPLDGLFIDCNENVRTGRINKWAGDLLKIYVTKTGFTFQEYEVARNISKMLIKQYQANDEVDKRDRLSELVVKFILEETKTVDAEMKELMNHFGVTMDKINSFVNKEDITYSSLDKNFIDYRDKKTGQHQIDRLIVLFSDLRLHKIYEDFCKKAGKGDQEFYLINQLLDPPSYKELRCVLFPVAQNPLVLPQHELYLPKDYQKKDPFEVWDNHLTKNVMKQFHLLPKSSYPANISRAEKNICMSFAKEIGLTEKFPTWLQ